MWSIEVSEDASEEEVIQAVLEELDFDYIRDCIAQLNDVMEKCGPLAEVQEATEDADSSAFTKTYHEKRGWICDDLASIDPLKVWTLSDDPVNGYSYLMNGYFFNEVQPGSHAVRTWYIADKSFEKVDDKFFTININPQLQGEL